jgi:hypothetical protein
VQNKEFLVFSFWLAKKACVLRITKKGLYVRTTIAKVPFHDLPIDVPPWKATKRRRGMPQTPPSNTAQPWKAALPYGFKRIYSRCSR